MVFGGIVKEGDAQARRGVEKVAIAALCRWEGADSFGEFFAPMRGAVVSTSPEQRGLIKPVRCSFGGERIRVGEKRFRVVKACAAVFGQ